MNGYIVDGAIHAHITMAVNNGRDTVSGHLEPGCEVLTYAIVAVGRRLHRHGHFKRITLVTELDRPRYSASDSVRYTGHRRGRSISGSKLSRPAATFLIHASFEGNPLMR